MSSKRILWAVLGGIVALIVMIALVIAVLVSHGSNSDPANNCATGIDNAHCNFVTVVRDTGKYSDKSDASVATYGDAMCSTMRDGSMNIVEALETNSLIVSAARSNICPDVN